MALDTSAYGATFADKNVANAKAVTVTGVALSGADVANYTVAQPTGLTANITALDVTGGFTADNKVYDGSTDATVLTRSLVGTLTGDVVSLSGGTAAFATPDVGNGITVTLTGATLAGADAGNYTLGSVGDTAANITPKELTVTAKDKTYDGSADASLTTTGLLVADDAKLRVLGGLRHEGCRLRQARDRHR